MSVDIVKKAKKFSQLIDAADTIAIIGHKHPDGDCIGSNLAMYNYITENFKGKTVDVYDEICSTSFKILSGYRKIKHEAADKRYDLAISIDVSDIDRLGSFKELYSTAISTVCIDHHVSNKGFGDLCYIVGGASSACEIMCDLLDIDKISEKTANCIYLGMVHDTGVFKYESTTRKTMELAGILIDKGARISYIIDETFYKKTYKQNKLMSRVILDSELMCDGSIITGVATRKILKEYKCTPLDADGIVEQLRLTEGVEVAIFAYQLSKDEYKFSMRAKNYVDVSVIATALGGGGHVRAAGFNTNDFEGSMKKVIEMAEAQLKTQKN